ncbi:MAG: hypothetical protein ACYCX2_05340 [Christensenellales bacterium]
MLNVIFGKKGEGKTKRIIAMANENVDKIKGSSIYIDDDSRYMFDIKHQIRFIDVSKYDIDSPKMFFGFLSGLAAQDYDLEVIYIDGFLKIVRYDLDKLDEFFTHVEELSNKFNLNIVISVSGNADGMPAYLGKYILKEA